MASETPRRRASDNLEGARWWVVIIRQVISEPGGVSILMLAVFVGMITGLIPSPITAIATELHEHEKSQLIVHKEIAVILKNIADEQSKINKWNEIRKCLDISNVTLRSNCLLDWGKTGGSG